MGVWRQTGRFLLKFRWFKIKRHVMVKGKSSPDDPNLREYWRKREQAKTKTLPKGKRDLAENQKGLCPVCGESLLNGEETNTHHKEPRGQGGTDSEDNKVLVHIYCHQ